jgi:hypothetical protein
VRGGYSLSSHPLISPFSPLYLITYIQTEKAARAKDAETIQELKEELAAEREKVAKAELDVAEAKKKAESQVSLFLFLYSFIVCYFYIRLLFLCYFYIYCLLFLFYF